MEYSIFYCLLLDSQLSRFNPFNKNQQLSDDDEDEYSRSNTSDYTSTTTSSDLSGDVSLAELGLTEDYFAHPKVSTVVKLLLHLNTS